MAELRRLVHALQEPAAQRERRLWWSRFRRRHQAGARRSHVARRARQAPLQSTPLPAPIQLPGLPALTDVQWEQLGPLLPPQKPQTGRPAIDHRLIVEGMLWVVRTGSSWRELPERFGPWSTVSSRYQRWCKEGLWARILQVLLPGSELRKALYSRKVDNYGTVCKMDPLNWIDNQSYRSSFPT